MGTYNYIGRGVGKIQITTSIEVGNIVKIKLSNLHVRIDNIYALNCVHTITYTQYAPYVTFTNQNDALYNLEGLHFDGVIVGADSQRDSDRIGEAVKGIPFRSIFGVLKVENC